jgi:hypothetical protein
LRDDRRVENGGQITSCRLSRRHKQRSCPAFRHHRHLYAASRSRRKEERWWRPCREARRCC